MRGFAIVVASIGVLGAIACQRDPGAPAAGSGTDLARRKHDCTEVVARIQAAVQTQIDQVGSAAQQMIDQLIPEMRTSCIEDQWPDALVSCVLQAKIGDAKAMEKCDTLMPKELQDRLQKRLMKAQPMPSQAVQGGPPPRPPPAPAPVAP